MARLIPKQKLDDISNVPERDVARLLVEQLPSNVTVFHSQPWLAPERDEIKDRVYLDQGEADFIILHPDYGILDLEVKGGRIKYAVEERNFYRTHPSGKTKQITDPFAQGQKNIHRIKRAIVKSVSDDSQLGHFVHGYAAIFPDCTYSGPLPPGGEDPRIVFDARHLQTLGREVLGAFNIWDRRSNSAKGRSLNQGTIERIRSTLLPEFRLKPSLYRSLERDEAELIRLTKSQSNLLTFLEGRNRALIKGVAGSGKTMLALEKAFSFATKGYRTLFLCYNELLAAVLRDQVPPNLRDDIVIRHFHGWCRECCTKPQARACGLRFSVPYDEDEAERFWNSKSADLLLQAIPLIAEKYDAVVVDEGQDFAGDWWYPVEEALTHSSAGKALYIFFDPDQNIYRRELQFPIIDDPYPLTENCRNTQKIARFCKAVVGSKHQSANNGPEGDSPSVGFASSREAQVEETQKLLNQLIVSDGLKPSQIAVLVAGGITQHSGFADLTKSGRHTFVRSVQAWKNNDGVLLESSKKFKGLEADVVILTCMPNPNSAPSFNDSDLYVSASRAKHRLYLICKTPEAEEYSQNKVAQSQ